jgi:hypothetical protein
MTRSPISIVADGRRRVLQGSAREATVCMKERLVRRTAPLMRRSSLLGRFTIRYRVWRFVQQQVAKRAPREALYSVRKFLFINQSMLFLTQRDN